MYERPITVLLLVVAVIQLLPISGMISADRLTFIYDIEIANPNLEILMRHRNEAIRRANIFDLVGTVALLGAVSLYFIKTRKLGKVTG